MKLDKLLEETGQSYLKTLRSNLGNYLEKIAKNLDPKDRENIKDMIDDVKQGGIIDWNYIKSLLPEKGEISDEAFDKIREAIKKLRVVESKDDAVLTALKSQGKSKGDPDSDFCEIELEIGTEVELEHVNSKEAAKEIAKDHLKENKHYYTEVLAPAEDEVMEKTIKILKKHGYGSMKEFKQKHKCGGTK